ncbi:MAG: enoyl-CoA hydratase/isomerase family protein [Deltaproteobacteria bacterium]|nr:MAG: enoyl-CoA hydratase/isomerase family protein [Deltaproteobacteria bacterium]
MGTGSSTAQIPIPSTPASKGGGMKNLRYAEEGGIGYLTIDRPHVRNAIDLETMGELDLLLGRLEGKAPRVLILTGGGEKVFIAGGDLKSLDELRTVEEGREMSCLMQRNMARLSALSCPVIAAVNGHCYGGGWEVAVACDLRVVSESARFGFRQAAMGLMTGWGGADRLVDLVGRARAKFLLWTAATISAQEALEIGLADRLAPEGEVLESAVALAREIMNNAPLAIRALKWALQAERSPEEAAERLGRLWVSEDHQEAVRAFFERRPPEWKGR